MGKFCEMFCPVSSVLIVTLTVMCFTLALSVCSAPATLKLCLKLCVKHRKVCVKGRVFQEERTFLHHYV